MVINSIKNFATERNLNVENISHLNITQYHKRTYEAITENILLYYSTKEGNNKVIKLLESINMIANDGEDKIIIYYKEDYFFDSLEHFNILNLNKWFDGIGLEINDYLCQLCLKKYISVDDIDMYNIQSIKRIDNQSINCSECNFKYCSECILEKVIPDKKCVNCNLEWKGIITEVDI